MFPEPGTRAAAGPPDGLTWRKVVVPDNFGSDDEFSAFFGPMWYRRTFADPWAGVTEIPEGRVRLRFRAVDYLADVWLNGTHLGHHEGSFAPFSFDVTDLLARANEVIVCVQDPLEPLDPATFFFAHSKRVIKGTLKYHDSRPGGLPGRMTGPLVDGDDPWVWTPEWGQSMTTAGITEAVELVRTGVCALDAMFVTPLEAEARVQIAAVITNHTDAALDATLHLGISDDAATAAITVVPGTSRVDLQVDLPHLARWEPVDSPRGTPEVHELRAVLAVADQVTDRRTVPFGLRTASVATDVDGRATHLEVNGHPIFVKAVNYIPWQHFADVGRAFYDRDMRMITEAHANSVGIHAHMQSPHAYDAADAAGILVFQDFPLQWFYDSGTETNPGFVDTACRQIAEMAYELHHHPSVVSYACHNEPRRMFVPTREADDTPERDLGERHLDAALFRTLRGVDDSRHVHEASGIGDDVHDYQGSLMGGSMYRVGERPAWFVSEYGCWTIGPQFAKFGDPPVWPPDAALLREWVSRLSFIGSTTSFAGRPERYGSLEGWADATESYGAALAKYQTEWFRAHRGAPFMGYRWHFWSDWWGYAGAGLVDVDRVPKRTYSAFRDASRPLLVVGPRRSVGGRTGHHVGARPRGERSDGTRRRRGDLDGARRPQRGVHPRPGWRSDRPHDAPRSRRATSRSSGSAKRWSMREPSPSPSGPSPPPRSEPSTSHSCRARRARSCCGGSIRRRAPRRTPCTSAVSRRMQCSPRDVRSCRDPDRGYMRSSSWAFLASYSSAVMWPWSRSSASCLI